MPTGHNPFRRSSGSGSTLYGQGKCWESARGRSLAAMVSVTLLPRCLVPVPRVLRRPGILGVKLRGGLERIDDGLGGKSRLYLDVDMRKSMSVILRFLGGRDIPQRRECVERGKTKEGVRECEGGTDNIRTNEGQRG